MSIEHSDGEEIHSTITSNILFNRIFQESPRPILLLNNIKNEEFRILSFNKQFKDFFKLNDSIINKKIDDILNLYVFNKILINKFITKLKNKELSFYTWIEDKNGELFYFQLILNYFNISDDLANIINISFIDSTKEYAKKNRIKINAIIEKTLNRVFSITSNPITDPKNDIPLLIDSFKKGFKADAILLYEFRQLFIDSEGVSPEFIIPKYYSDLSKINVEFTDAIIFTDSNEFKEFDNVHNSQNFLKQNIIFNKGTQYLIPILVKDSIIGIILIHYENKAFDSFLQSKYIFRISRLISNYFERVKYREEIAMFEQAFQQSQESIVITDGNLTLPGPQITYVNGAFEKMTGYRKDELIGKTPRILQGPKTDRSFLEKLKKTIGEGKSFQGETFNYKKDRTEYNIEWAISPIKDINNKITHYVSTQRDITEKVNREREINKRLKYEIGLAAISQILLYPNPSDDVLNLAIEQLMIFSEVTTIFIASKQFNSNQFSIDKIESRREDHRSLSEIIIPESWLNNLSNDISVISDLKIAHDVEKLFLIENNYYSIIFFNLKNNSQSKDFKIIGIAVAENDRFLSDDDILLLRTASNLIAVFLERLDNLQEIQNHRDRLQLLVDERTADLMEAKLKAEAANKAKTDFLANMTHELRTPLNSILGFSRLLKPNENFPDQQKYLDYIHNSGIHLLKLINELLDLSKIESGKSELVLSKLEIVSTTKLSIESMEPQANKKNIKLILNNTQKHLYIIGDEKRTRQVILNILSNAIKFSYPDKEITINLDPISINNSNFIVIKVIDQGIGMEENEIPTIFEKFTQLENGKEMESNGTGLGLSICHKLVESMNGYIEVESKLKQGTTMSIYLPQYKDVLN